MTYNTLKEDTEKWHKKAHRLAEGKNPEHKAGYYDFLAGMILKRLEKFEIQIKELQKQQKYLWQTLDEKKLFKELEK